jgi:Fe-S cluster biogenesis protein NfuA/rhodanese-related sulfurtransferase
MFGPSKDKLAQLESRVAQLETELKKQRVHYEGQIQILRQQLTGLATGVAPRPESILRGLAYSEIPKEEVLHFIRNVPNVLVLDVRGDPGWEAGHIPEAKHIPAPEVFQRLGEIPDKSRPILTVCANGNTAVGICQLLVREGYRNVFNALGGMAGYDGPVIRPEVQASDITKIRGTDRKLIDKVISVLDRDVRPGLKRDGGDLEVVEVEGGTVKLKLVGACVGCGAQKRTVEDGIKTHLQKLVPEIDQVLDVTLGFPN